MQKARSGLATVAARMQLTDAPEGESSLHSQLREAERRAKEAESAAQDAQAALARTLLEAARVEAVVTARVKAESEAEVGALRAELDTLKQSATPHGQLQGGAGQPLAEQTSGEPGISASPEMPDPQNTVSDAATSASEATPEGRASPGLRATSEDRPDWLVSEDEPVAEPRLFWILAPARLVYLSIVAVVAVASYLVTSSYLERASTRQAVNIDTRAVVMHEASGRLDPARRSGVGEKARTGSPVSQNAETAPMPTPSANWLLYMPIERAALVEYLAGRNWPGIQMAGQPESTAPRRN